MITLWSLLKAGLLVLNGATILHRGRFLKKGTDGHLAAAAFPGAFPAPQNLVKTFTLRPPLSASGVGCRRRKPWSDKLEKSGGRPATGRDIYERWIDRRGRPSGPLLGRSATATL